MPVAVGTKFQNDLLASLTAADLALFTEHLAFVNFARSDLLVEAQKPIGQVYFIEMGMASVMAITAKGTQTEVAVIGNEGMLDIATILGSTTAPLQITVQMPGHGYTISSSAFLRALEQSATLRTMMLIYAQAFFAQIAQTALAAATLSIKARIARRLLLCDDRIMGCAITMTHELLSLMLNVRRPGVSEAMQAIAATGAIRCSRGKVEIQDRTILQQIAGPGYGKPPPIAPLDSMVI